MRGTLCDTGPLVALLDNKDPHHSQCLSALPNLPNPLITTWPCLTEAMYFAFQAGGLSWQEALWDLVADGELVIHESSAGETKRMRELMKQYGDAPMDLADASLVAAAETLGMRRVFTLDGHFRAYRIGGKETFEIAP